MKTRTTAAAAATATMFRARIVSIFVLFVCEGVARGRTGYATKERISSVWGNDRVVTWISGEGAHFPTRHLY